MNELYFRATLDTMTPLMIEALIDIAEGEIVSADWYDTDQVYRALVERDLIGAEVVGLTYASEPLGTEVDYQEAIYELTAYGRAFLAWYRQPRDVPGQLPLWEG